MLGTAILFLVIIALLLQIKKLSNRLDEANRRIEPHTNEADHVMAPSWKTATHRILAWTCLATLFASLFLGYFGPYLAGKNYQPGWLAMAATCIGLIAVATAPFAWRWFLVRRSK